MGGIILFYIILILLSIAIGFENATLIIFCTIIFILIVFAFYKVSQKEYVKKYECDSTNNQNNKSWEEILATEIDIILPEDINLFDYLQSLFEKYDVSIKDILFSKYEEHEFLKDLSESDSEEEYMEQMRLYEYSRAYFCFSEHRDKKIDENEIKRRHNMYLMLTKKCRLAYHDEISKEEMFKVFGKDFPPLPEDPPKVLYTKNRTVRQRMFENLLSGIDTPSPPMKLCNKAAKYYKELIKKIQ